MRGSSRAAARAGRAALRLGDAAWLERVGAAARAVGGEEFPARLLGVLGDIIAHDMAMIVRYSRFAPPDFLICEGIPRHILELYRSGYYRFDPFYSYWQDRELGGVVTLREVSPPDLAGSDYRRVFQRQARICDELGMFLPGIGRTSVALFLERSVGWFRRAEIARAKAIYPVVAGLYRAHVGRLFAALAAGPPGPNAPGTRPIMLVDAAGRSVFASRAWREAEAEGPAVARAVDSLGAARRGQVALSGERILHVEPLDPDFPLAPAGRIYTIEPVGLAPARLRPREVIARFGTELTARERDIVALILEGYPTASIAKRLGIGRGTVKNHRRRLYYKLDITSERELFLLYLGWLASPEASGSGAARATADERR